MEQYIPYGHQWIEEQDIEAVTRVLRSDYLTQGPEIEIFENKVAAMAGTRHAVAFCNGTAALHAACDAAGLGDGDEVITTPLTFAASANCALYVGATPVFADIDPVTMNISPESIRKCMTPRTRAIIPVHFTGLPCDMDAIMAIAREHQLVVIEDAAHAVGAQYHGKSAGSFGDMAMFSFHPVKQITSGEGGMIVTSDDSLARRLKMFRTHGITRDAAVLEQKSEGPWYYEQQFLGYNYRMTDFQAALGSSQMDRMDAWLARRREIVGMYQSAFAEQSEFICPAEPENSLSGWHLYVIRIAGEQPASTRRRAFEMLRDQGLGVNVHYVPVYRHPYYQKRGYTRAACPVAEDTYDRIISLPLYPMMTDAMVRQVIQTVRAVFEKIRRNER